MPADIKHYQSNVSRNFGKNGFVNQSFTITELYALSKTREIEYPEFPNFAREYLPEIQYTDVKSYADIFMKTSTKTFEIDGSQCARFILLDDKGQLYDDLTLWTQVLPHSFLARISCSYRNFDASSLILNYFIDLDNIQLNNEVEYGGQIITVIDKEITGGYATRDNTKIKIHDWIADFNNHKSEIFYEYFKYDFGNVVKNLSLAK